MFGECPIAMNKPVIFISETSLLRLFLILMPSTTFSPITSSISWLNKTLMLSKFANLFCIAFEALKWSFLTNMVTLLHIFAKYVASSIAVSPPPTIATSWFL